MECPSNTIILCLPALCNMTSELDADAGLALTAESPEFADTVGIKAIDDYTLQYTADMQYQ